MTDPTQESGLTRRNLVKGAAWAAPVIMAAVVTPLAAASPTQAQIIMGGNCSSTGRPQYFFFVTAGLVAAGSTFTITGPYQQHFSYVSEPAGAYSFAASADGSTTTVTLNIDIDTTSQAPAIFLQAVDVIPELSGPTTIDYVFQTGVILPAGSNVRQHTDSILLTPEAGSTTAACA